MSETRYNTLEFSGNLLMAGFSIYLVEIINNDKKWFYIGMTGDNHYQSARSAFHRLSGHFELNPKSTQNQVWKYLKEQINEADFSKCKIKMYHFPIEGFYKTEDYSFYKKKQQEVQQLESKLIYDFKDSLLNKTKGKYIETLNDTLKTVYEIIGEIISKPINTEGV